MVLMVSTMSVTQSSGITEAGPAEPPLTTDEQNQPQESHTARSEPIGTIALVVRLESAEPGSDGGYNDLSFPGLVAVSDDNVMR